MHVIEVIPLKRGVQVESLSYFSSTPYTIGSFIMVPVRGKQIQAIVINTKPVSSTKTALKAASFSLRKIPPQNNVAEVSSALMQTVHALADRYPAQPGSILYALLPPDIRNGARPFPVTKPHHADVDTTPQILQAPLTERYVHYRSHVRAQFAHRGSVLFVVPTSADVTFATEILSSGIHDRIITFTPHQTKKARDQAYEALHDLSYSKLIITTPSFAYLDREDITSIIVEQSASTHYKMRTRPYLDHRDVLRTHARSTNRTIIFGDLVARTEEEYARRQDIFLTVDEYPKRVDLPARLRLVQHKDKATPNTPFQLLTPELTQSITNTLDAKGRVFLYAARRGLAPVVTCVDCGHIFRCPESGSPYSLLRTTIDGVEQRWFLSTVSGKKVPAADVCPVCGGWRLRERGIGIQQVVDCFTEQFPDTHVIVFDHTTARTHRKATDLQTKFYNQKRAVMIGTSMALPYLTKPITLSAIVSLDATRTIPSWRADEQLFHLLLNLRERSEKEVLVQMRTETDDLLVYASQGHIERFHDDEIKLRTMLNYPPAAYFSLLSWSGSEQSTRTVEQMIHERLERFKPLHYANPQSTPQKTVRHALIRTPAADWPNRDLLTQLRQLPPYIKIEINPDRIV